MSLEALNWALRQPVFASSQKFILVLLGNYAGDRGITYPSIPSLAKATALTEETVRTSLDKLVAAGLIADTGKKAGATGKIRVFQFPAEAWSSAEQSPNGLGIQSPNNPQAIPKQSPNSPAHLYKGTGTVFSANGKKAPLKPETLEECLGYGKEIGLPKKECEAFFDFFTSNGWKVSGRATMRDWKAAMRNWKRNFENRGGGQKEFKVGGSNL